MKHFLAITILFLLSGSCSKTMDQRAQATIKEYLEANLKAPDSYEPLSFSGLDSLPIPDTSETKKISLFSMKHNYTIVNDDQKVVPMSMIFLLDKDLKVNESNRKSLNGNYGTFTGNAYWKYNNYVGNRPDAGAEVVLYSLDTIRNGLKYEAEADVQGNYKIERILPGAYFVQVSSENATDCPEYHILNLSVYREGIKDAFGFDIAAYEVELRLIDSLRNEATETLMNESMESFLRLAKYEILTVDERALAKDLIESFPDDFKSKVKLNSAYGKAMSFKWVEIVEDESKSMISDFGITCI